jgi:phosphoglycolate phosphatase-like HAD superfamily hydrolase
MIANASHQPASLAELKHLTGADPDFIVEQLEAGATLQESMHALNQRLAAAVEAAERKLASSPTQTNFDDAFRTAQTTGLDAHAALRHVVSGTSHFAAVHEPRDLADKQAVAEFQTHFNELRAKGMNATAAAKAVYERFPHLASAAVSSHEAKCSNLR